ncbi:hypothetical protein [Streptomyces sp. DH10]|uniref:hypothetical protein n=1 Tax=Streptomyces sp. DH10 TaxID=3040121 RepID=UPI002441635C|nr:hypothetical protein [Streptomyces sp. DH10]MDG9709417.1 hypothetical protein [Streptomyces sp. DH10]
MAAVHDLAHAAHIHQYFANHPADPIPPTKIGGTLTSIRAVKRRVGPAGAHQLLQRHERARPYRIDRPLLEGLQRAYASPISVPTSCDVDQSTPTAPKRS